MEKFQAKVLLPKGETAELILAYYTAKETKTGTEDIVQLTGNLLENHQVKAQGMDWSTLRYLTLKDLEDYPFIFDDEEQAMDREPLSQFWQDYMNQYGFTEITTCSGYLTVAMRKTTFCMADFDAVTPILKASEKLYQKMHQQNIGSQFVSPAQTNLKLWNEKLQWLEAAVKFANDHGGSDQLPDKENLFAYIQAQTKNCSVQEAAQFKTYTLSKVEYFEASKKITYYRQKVKDLENELKEWH